MFTPGTLIYYRICTKNQIGYGACSPSMSVLTDIAPIFMNPPVVNTDDVHP